ncbi:MAG: hypothetical protein NC038_00090 [Paludibacter sp.]|nr:hypothetical protein [Bacteroidales bacterium]MCM1068762.1 hypothetical protein [Prevotella sp.]MCM1354474.1 hypothetical protein [Bacteroides sp.]MCM1443277.1 hypothetical protein [Muribaculum sp.]MCM1481038.1 hypothetical protein [Paludibacter sp.]
MKRILLFCLITFLTAANLWAEVLLEENFKYGLGSMLTDNGWFTQYRASSDISVTNALSVPRYAPSDIGGAALIDCISGSDQPHRAFLEQTEGDIYVAFMFAPLINNKKGWFFALRDNNFSAGYNSEYNFNARLLLDDSNRIGLAFADNQKAQFADSYLDYNTTYLVVIKYTVNAGACNDAVSLWLFKEAVPDEPAQPLIGPLTDAAKKDINPANVVLRGYDANGWLVVDGIRVATTWQEAVLMMDDNTAINNVSIGSSDEPAYIYNCLGTCLGIYSENAFSALPRGIYVIKTLSASHKVLR